jgi:hypothetical protein
MEKEKKKRLEFEAKQHEFQERNMEAWSFSVSIADHTRYPPK